MDFQSTLLVVFLNYYIFMSVFEEEISNKKTFFI